MTSILTAVASAMKEVRQHETRAALATQAVGWFKPMVIRAGGIINGQGGETDVDYIMSHTDASRTSVSATRRQRRDLPRRQNSAGAPRPRRPARACTHYRGTN